MLPLVGSEHKLHVCTIAILLFVFPIDGAAGSRFLSHPKSRKLLESNAFHNYLDSDIGFRFFWHMTEEAINFTLSIEQPNFRWFAFGFVRDDLDDLVVLKLKGKRFYFKVEQFHGTLTTLFSSLDQELSPDIPFATQAADCYLDPTIGDPTIRVDSQQDYHVVKSNLKKGLKVTFHRLLDTQDIFDVMIKAGKVKIVWAYGQEISSRRLSQDYLANRITGQITMNPSQDSSPEESTNISAPEVELQPTTIEVLATTHMMRKKTTEGPSGQEKSNAEDGQPSSEKHSAVERKRNCTIIIQKSSDWYEMLRMRENSVYYAIIGSAALLTGVIVLMLACCCARKKVMVSPRQKVAFYKVDDYDDEQVEFLREKEGRR